MFSDISTFLETRLDYFQATTTPTARTAAFSTSEKEIDMARQLTRSLLFASEHPRADLRFAARNLRPDGRNAKELAINDNR